MMLETQRLILRDWRDDDIDQFIALRADPRVMAHFPSTNTEAEVRVFYPGILKKSRELGYGFRPIILHNTGEFLGFCGIAETNFETPFGPITEIGWSLHHKYWGKGYATEAARAWLDHAFGTLEKPEIVAFTTTTNLPSQSVMKRLGMQRDKAKDFDHPNVPDTHPELLRHIVYTMTKLAWDIKKGG